MTLKSNLNTKYLTNTNKQYVLKYVLFITASIQNYKKSWLVRG